MTNSSYNIFMDDVVHFHEFDIDSSAAASATNNETALLMVQNLGIDSNRSESYPKMMTIDNTDELVKNIKRITIRQVVPVLYFVLFVLGVAGNSVVIYVSCFLTKTSKNTVDIFVGNLAVADLAMITTLPFWAVTNILGGTWIFEDSGCKIMSFLTHLNMSASVFLITAMAIDRYTVVVKAVKVRAKSLRTAQRTMCSCAVIWSFSLILSLPAAIMREKVLNRYNMTVCSWVYPPKTQELWWALHIVTRNIIGFVIPLSIICRCYCVIVSYVRDRSAPQQNISGSRSGEAAGKQQQRVTRLVTAIIMAFVICWFPNQLSNFSHSLIHFGAIPWPESKLVGEIIYLVHIFTTVLSFCNSVVNPVIYSTSPTHRMHIKILFFRVFRCFKNAREEDEMYAKYHAIAKDPGRSPNTGTRRMTEITRLQPINYDCAVSQSAKETNVTPASNAMKSRSAEGSTTNAIAELPNGASTEPGSLPQILVNGDSVAGHKCDEKLTVEVNLHVLSDSNQNEQDENENDNLL